MKRKDGESEGGESRPPAWRERLNRWLSRMRSEEPQAKAPHDQWVEEVVGDLVVPLSVDALASAKRTYLHRLHRALAASHYYGLDQLRREQQEEGRRLDPLALYQPLNTTTEVPCEEQEREAGGKTLLPAHPRTRPLTLLEAVDGSDRTLVRGSHGMGKSTFLRYLALCMSEPSPEGGHPGLRRLQPAWQHGWLFPLWVDLRAYGASPRSDGTAAGLCAYIADELGVEPDQLCWQIIGPGGVLLLLDGLERAPVAVAEFLDGLDHIHTSLPEHQPSRVIVTAQPYVAHARLGGGVLAAYTVIDLAPWQQGQIDGYARAWYAELLRKGWIDTEEARDLPGQLCSALRREEVRRLAQRPSLMSTISLLHAVHERLPGEPALLYHALFALAVAVWSEGQPDGARDLQHVVDLEAMRSVVAQITYQGQMRVDGPLDLVHLSESDLRAALLPVCRDGRWETANELVTRILERPSLLDEQSSGVYTFVERDLQVYVASRHLIAQPDLPELVVELVKGDFYRWRDVVRFAFTRLARLEEDVTTALALVGALVGSTEPVEGTGRPTETEWRMAWLAGEMLASFSQPLRTEGPARILRRTREQLAALLSEGQLVPLERAQGGRALDRLPGGDPRPGVATAEGLWCEVPAGETWIGEGAGAQLVDSPAFWIARYPVTNAQYMAFVEATGHAPPSHWRGNLPALGTGNHPVVQVTWEDVMAYCRWWNEQVRRRVPHLWRAGETSVPAQMPREWQARLPRSVEWEKAARGGLLVPASSGDGLVSNPLPRRRYPWGDDWTLSTPQHRGDETRCNVSESNIGTTTPVGMYPSGVSPYGVMDLAGNVWEWCLDWADEEQCYRVRRGGAFRYTHEQARCSAADRVLPGLAWPYVGFRLVVGLPVDGQGG